jgi:phage protein D
LPSVEYELAINDKLIDEPSFYEGIQLIEVEDNDTTADTFSLKLSAIRDATGLWSYAEKDKFELFNKVRITASFSNGNTEHLIEGYITEIKFHIDKEERKSYVEINGMDPTVLMNLQEKLVSWVDKPDHQIAKEIFSKYGFDTSIDNAVDPQLEPGYVVIQRETDIEFLKRLALRNGFECFVKKDFQEKKSIGFFRKPKLDLAPQKDLAVQFDERNNVTSIDFTIDGLRPLSVEIRQQDHLSEEIKEIKISDSKLQKIGKRNLSDVIQPNIGRLARGENLVPTIILSRHVVSEPQLMEAVARSVYDNGSWFVTAKGIVNAEAYGSVLKAKNLVLIKGADEAFSGKYYVSKVVHKFKPESYVQEFEAKKNAMGVVEESDAFEKASL